MVAMVSKRRCPATFAAMLFVYLSVVVMASVPAVRSGATQRTPSSLTGQNPDASSQLLAATDSLQAGQGPSEQKSVDSAFCGLMFVGCASSIGQTSSSPLAAANTGWTKLGPPSPPGRGFGSMAYDAADGYVVLFGGISSASPVGDTWKFSNGGWTQIITPTAPSARFVQSMTYDAADGYVLLFGGFGLVGTQGKPLSDTWKFSNGVWTNITGTSGPSPRVAASVTYDAGVTDRYVVLFGGLSTIPTTGAPPPTALKDTWKFSQGSWTNITAASGPSGRAGASMSYDSADGYALLYGGLTQTSVLSDTWSFSGGSWTSVTPSGSPGPRALAAMTFDAATGDNYVVMFGGASADINNNLANPLGDTWKFSGGSWTNITSPGPPPQFGSAMAFDASPGDGFVLVLGVGGFSWKFLGGAWSAAISSSFPGPYPRVGPSMAYDAADGYVVLFGGAKDTSPVPPILGDTWKFAAGAWTNITSSLGPPATAYATMAYDGADGYVVLLDGGQTWTFKGGAWSMVTTTNSPGPRAGASMIFDPLGSNVVLFGGTRYNSGVGLGDTWEYKASVWTNVTVTVGKAPSPRVFAPMAYDAADGYGVLFGGIPNFNLFPAGLLGDTWKFSGGSWTNITTTGGPSPRMLGVMDYDTADGYTLLFGGGNGSGFQGDTWIFSVGAWTNIPNIFSPPPRSNGSMVYDPADHFLVLFGGTSSNVGLGDTWTWSQQGLKSWTPHPSMKGPSPRFWGSMAYDPTDGYVVLVGGAINKGTGVEYINDTWKYQAGVWTNITSTAGYPHMAVAPSPMAYDASDGYLLLFGAGTWKFQSGVWTNISGNCSPATCPSGYHAAMTYDAADQRIVLFGGFNSSITKNQGLSDTWEFHTGVWTKIVTTVQPSGRELPSMAYDAADGHVVLFGGDNNNNPNGPAGYRILGDTWKFVGGTWTNITSTTNPPASTNSMMSYDAGDGYVILFGGNNFATGSFGDTWEFSGGTWTIIPTAVSPSARDSGSMAYDDADRYVVLFGGSANNVDVNDTWTWGPFAGTTTTFTSLVCLPSTIAIGQTSTCIVHVSDAGGQGGTDPTGTVNFSANGAAGTLSATSCILVTLNCQLGDGLTGTASGIVTVTATYAGDSIHADSSAMATVTVANLHPTFMSTIICTPTVIVVDQPLTCTAYVKDTSATGATPPTGLVALPTFTSSFTGIPYVTCTLSTYNATSSSCSGVGTRHGSCPSPGCPKQAWYYGDATHDGTTAFNAPITVNAHATTTSINCIPASVQIGASTVCSVTVTDTETLYASPPSGTVSFASNGTGILISNPCSLMSTGAASSSCFVEYQPTSASKARTDTITGSYGGEGTHAPSNNTFNLGVTVTTAFDFSLSAPSTVTLDQGTATPSLGFPVVATLTSGSPSQVTFSIISALPTGVTATFVNNPCSPTCTTGIGFSATTTATVGTSTLEIQAVGGGVTKTVRVSLTVLIAFDFSLSTPSPNSLTVIQGSTSQSSSITATTVSGSPTRSVGFVITQTLPGGVSAAFTNDPCLPTCTVTVSFSATSIAALGTFTITIVAVGGDLGSRTTQLSLIILAPAAPFEYSLSVNPASASIVVGGSTSATVTATLTSGTAQPVALYLAAVSPSPTVCLGSSQPCGPTTFTPLTITPSSTGATSTMTISTTNLVPPGTYALTVAGSPAGSSSSSATFTLTITVPSVSTVGCGHNESCGVVSNATLSNVKIAGNTLHIEADGTRGAHGYANVTVPKSEIPNIDDMHVFVDNNKLNSGVTITSNSTAYFIYFTFTFHSPVKIDIQLSAPQQTPNAPTILGIDQTLFYEIVGGVIAAIVIVSAVVVVARRRKTKTPA